MTTQRQRRTSLLDQISPSWDARERHHRPVKAAPQLAFDAMVTVQPSEIRLLQSLFAIRLLPARVLGDVPPGPPPQRSLFDLMLESGFTELASAPPDEVVVGQIARFWQLGGIATHPVENADEFIAFDDPGWCKAAMNIRCRPAPGGCHIMTETRILATDPGARRKFRLYWAIVLPGSAVIRRNWLAAAARKAEELGSRD